MTFRGERHLILGLWTGWAVLGAAGLGLLAFALFSNRALRPLPKLPGIGLAVEAPRGNPDVEALAGKRMSKGVAERSVNLPKASGPAPIDSVLRLKGVMDFGKARPAEAVVELLSERKTGSFLAGDKLGQSGAVLKAVGETVVVEYERRRWKLTYKGAQELPAAAVGDNR